MSTASRPTSTSLPLIAGQRLDQVTFHERYEAMPPGIKVELIDGVVYMASPVGTEHGDVSGLTLFWLNYFRARTPGVQVLDNASVLLSPTSEVQPDVTLRILPDVGGRSRDERGYIGGAPELVVEVAHSTKNRDLGVKLAAYERAGVLEYVVFMLEPDAIRWHRLQDGKLIVVAPDADGFYRSSAFPGLWLDPVAMLELDLQRLMDGVNQGTATPAHAAFVARLQAEKP